MSFFITANVLNSSHVLEIMGQLSESIPQLDIIADTIKTLANQEEGNDENLHVIEVTLPMLCR